MIDWNRFMSDALAKLAFKESEQTPSKKMQDNEDWWKRHQSYIEHRKKYPYGKPPEIKGEKE